MSARVGHHLLFAVVFLVCSTLALTALASCTSTGPDDSVTSSARSTTTREPSDQGTGQWTKIESQSAPPARLAHSAVFDTHLNGMLIFGGTTFETRQVEFSDTWLYQPASKGWEDLGPSSAFPGPVYFVPTTYDPVGLRSILLRTANTTEGEGAPEVTTWAFDSTRRGWSELAPEASPPPTVSLVGTMVYCDATESVFLLDGDELWEYIPAENTWRVRPMSGTVPEPRVGASFAYAPGLETIVLFGGWTSAGPLNDTWLLEPESASWSKLEPPRAPPSRSQGSLAVDPGGGDLILFGGTTQSGSEALSFGLRGGTVEGLLGDTWSLDIEAASWTRLEPQNAPSPRAFHSMVYDSASNSLLLFGGLSSSAPLMDTWTYELPEGE